MLREGNERGKGIACVGKEWVRIGWSDVGWEYCEDGTSGEGKSSVEEPTSVWKDSTTDNIGKKEKEKEKKMICSIVKSQPLTPMLYQMDHPLIKTC